MQVTLLMPVFNAEQWIDNSIKSLLAQTSSDWRLIAVDDGSTDGSLARLRKYEAQDKRISVITQQNAGPGAARAKAIERATTDYVAILDSDDALTPSYVEMMLKRAAETDADSIVPDVEYFSPDGSQVQPNQFERLGLKADMIINDGQEAFALTFPWRIHGWQMIRTSLAKKYYTVELASYSRFNSDEYITRLLYLKSRCTALCSAIYKYRVDPSSITRKPTLLKMDYFKTLKKLLHLSEEECLNRSIIVEVYNDYYVTIRNMREKVLPLLPSEDQSTAERIIAQATKDFKLNFHWINLRGSSARTIIKYLMFFCFGYNK